ncbi:hypothetical protein EJV46_14550 [Roseococcus sp. SYP-B2431]|nr:hypothetical protein EJV46_14550 [Roseococcus sp. SYP-B2431]
MLPILFASAPAWAQTTGLCPATPDRADRLECLGRPADRPLAPQPPAAAARDCTPAAPCTDSRGAYYTMRSGGKRYVSRR